MNPAITIRLATEADAAAIATISRQTFYDTFATVNTPENMNRFMTEQFSHDMLMRQVGAPGNIFLLAYNGADLLGYARLHEENLLPQLQPWRAIEICRLYATRQAIGKGVGSALMERCIDLARSADKQVIWLGVWEKNQRAIDFYQRWGFEKFGEHVFMLGDDAQTDWLMWKRTGE